MKTDTDSDNWRKKYLETLGSLESEQQRFRAIEAALKRIAGRLCTASQGQSPQLDEQIKKLQTAMRREATGEELDQITSALTGAIQALDQPIAAASIAPAPPILAAQPAKPQPDLSRDAIIDSERVQAVLAVLLAELRRDAELTSQVDALDSRLGTSMAPEQLPEILSSLTELVGKRIKRIEVAKQEIEVLLGHMVEKLDEISQFVADQNQSQNQSQASSDTLNVQLAGEMKAMGESVESADDLQQIRVQVRGRLDSIDRHLQEFREREADLTSAMRTRSEQMRSRISELEAEASHLQSQLNAEQRLSTIDALTKIPNRLAYEKRIEEEFMRWQRFKQPTCIAVLDVDHFKRVNDTYGHQAGDRVLSTVADNLAERIRGTDFLARYGGEEFVLVLAGTKLEDATRVVEELRIAVSRIRFHSRGTQLSVTISSGVTALQNGDSSASAFERADKAMYEAKKSGRDRSVSV